MRNNIKELTELCATTKWRHNVATKYLMVVKYAIKLDDEATEENMALDSYEIVSKALCDILVILNKKLADYVTVPLTYEDIMLAYACSYVGGLIC